MAPLSEVPASSTKLSGRSVYSSVSLEAIQTYRGESIWDFLSLSAATM